MSIKILQNSTLDEYNIPTDISDILNVCREYNKLGWKLQNQIEYILDVGIENALKENIIEKKSLPQIKRFFKSINGNAYFGDAAIQANEIIKKIEKVEIKINYLN